MLRIGKPIDLFSRAGDLSMTKEMGLGNLVAWLSVLRLLILRDPATDFPSDVENSKGEAHRESASEKINIT